jgi:hypothetical protein
MARGRTFTFCLSTAVAEGVPLTTARRAIRELEGAGLITVERPPGRGLVVTLTEPESAGAEQRPDGYRHGEGVDG